MINVIIKNQKICIKCAFCNKIITDYSNSIVFWSKESPQNENSILVAHSYCPDSDMSFADTTFSNQVWVKLNDFLKHIIEEISSGDPNQTSGQNITFLKNIKLNKEFQNGK